MQDKVVFPNTVNNETICPKTCVINKLYSRFIKNNLHKYDLLNIGRWVDLKINAKSMKIES